MLTKNGSNCKLFLDFILKMRAFSFQFGKYSGKNSGGGPSSPSRKKLSCSRESQRVFSVRRPFKIQVYVVQNRASKKPILVSNFI